MNENFISLTDNDEFTKLRGLDLQELLVQVENYFLEYRTLLGLPNDLTFGVEIEYEFVSRRSIDKFVDKKLFCWNSKRDASLSSGGEINSPVMMDELKYWKELKLICDHLTKVNADTQHNAGGHIHIGANILGNDIDAWRNFLKLYTSYENILFRFIYGDKISARKRLHQFAQPLAENIDYSLRQIDNETKVENLSYILPSFSRYKALNFSNTLFDDPSKIECKNTIEFRGPNATTNAIVWQNNINTFAKMLVSSRNKVMNEDFLDYKLKNELICYSDNKYMYDCINIKNALEFVDLVFDNNLDKIYFLRQYLKDLQEGYGNKEALKSKRFVKKGK